MTTPRWLSADEEQAWRAFVLGTRLFFGALERDLQRTAGLPLIDYEILSVLSNVPNRVLRMSQLALIEQISASRLSHAVTRLEQEGWVRRELCPSDRRGWLAVLTDEGYAVLEAAAPHHVESVRKHLFDQLAPEQVEEMCRLGEALLGHLAPDSDPGCDLGAEQCDISAAVSQLRVGEE